MVVYETISGHLPFYGYPTYPVVLKVLEGERPRRERCFTDDIWRMLESCWHPRPDIRPLIRDVLLCLEQVPDLPKLESLSEGEGTSDNDSFGTPWFCLNLQCTLV